MKIQYEMRPFGSDMFIVSRQETRSIPIKGLPSTISQCIIIHENEIENFVESLQKCLLEMKSNNSVN